MVASRGGAARRWLLPAAGGGGGGRRAPTCAQAQVAQIGGGQPPVVRSGFARHSWSPGLSARRGHQRPRGVGRLGSAALAQWRMREMPGGCAHREQPSAAVGRPMLRPGALGVLRLHRRPCGRLSC